MYVETQRMEHFDFSTHTNQMITSKGFEKMQGEQERWNLEQELLNSERGFDLRERPFWKQALTSQLLMKNEAGKKYCQSCFRMIVHRLIYRFHFHITCKNKNIYGLKLSMGCFFGLKFYWLESSIGSSYLWAVSLGSSSNGSSHLWAQVICGLIRLLVP